MLTGPVLTTAGKPSNFRHSYPGDWSAGKYTADFHPQGGSLQYGSRRILGSGCGLRGGR